jgi:peptidylprolyl isomerase
MFIKKRIISIATLIVIGLVMTILLPGCNLAPATQNGDTVQVNYTLSLEDGTTYETTVGKEPVELALGEGKSLPDFENAIVGMKVGELKTITIPAADAYGEHIDGLELTINRSQLAEGLNPKVGDYLASEHESGRTMYFVVTDVSDEEITLDANHPLAGEDLTFEIELLKIS